MTATAEVIVNVIVGSEEMVMEEVEGMVVDWGTFFDNFFSEEEDDKKENITFNNRPPTANRRRWSQAQSVCNNLELWFGSPLPSPLLPSPSPLLFCHPTTTTIT